MGYYSLRKGASKLTRLGSLSRFFSKRLLATLFETLTTLSLGVRERLALDQILVLCQPGTLLPVVSNAILSTQIDNHRQTTSSKLSQVQWLEELKSGKGVQGDLDQSLIS